MTTPTTEPDPPKSSPRLAVWIPVIVAVIGLVATVTAALITRSHPPAPEPSHPSSATASVPPAGAATAAATSATAAACPSFATGGGSVPSVTTNPEAATHDVTLVAAAYLLDRGVRPATITVAGRLTGTAPTARHLYVLQRPDTRTYDSTPDHHAGSGRFYPSGEIAPDDAGCFIDTPQSIGYDEAIGITFDQLLVQADDSASADFANTDAWHQHDGYSAGDLDRLHVDTLASFSVPTA